MAASSQLVDLRSDTVTRPTEAMRRALARAEVGDDVYGEDPTVRRLEARAAEMLGTEAALFVPSGTMGNQIAIHLHTRPGTDVLLEEGSHVLLYELGAMAAWSGALPRVVRGSDGRIDAQQLAEAIPPPLYYLARPTLLVVENTHNHAGGRVMDLPRQAALLAVAREAGLKTHLDGARIFNAALALEVEPRLLAQGFDTVMFCLSKGLGAPVGSMLCGDAPTVERARVVRKRMGGGLRQAGILAAAGLHALQHHVARLADDHRRARRLAEELATLPGLRVDPRDTRTNIVIAELRDPALTEEWVRRLREGGVLAGTMGPGRIRFVTHLDVDDGALDRVFSTLKRLRAD